MKMVRSIDGARNIQINLPSPELFIGMTIDKRNTFSVCNGTEDFINSGGEKIKLLVWEITLKETGQIIVRKTVSKNFRVSDLPGTDGAFNKTP